METDIFPVYSKSFFELQSVFAQKIAELSKQPIEQVLLQFTSLYRILGLDWSLDPANLVWQDYIQGLQRTSGQLEFTYQFYLQRYPTIPRFADGEHWGCFAFDYNAESQIVHIHFSDEDRSSYGPLSHRRIEVRKTELKAMFQQIQARYPDVAVVQGGSWLYNWEAYKRLFPQAFSESVKRQEIPGLYGRALWSQFLRRGWKVDQETMSLFLSRVDQMERVEDYPNCFPYPVLLTEAPVHLFYEFYANA